MMTDEITYTFAFAGFFAIGAWGGWPLTAAAAGACMALATTVLLAEAAAGKR